MWWIVGVVVLVALFATYVTWAAGRVDRLHLRAVAAWSALDAHLVRRATAAGALAETLADADLRQASLAALTAAVEDRELAENDLTRALRRIPWPRAAGPAALDGPALDGPAPPGSPRLEMAEPAARSPVGSGAVDPAGTGSAAPGGPGAAGGSAGPGVPRARTGVPVVPAADPVTEEYAEVVASSRQVALTRQVHNDLVRDALAVRRRRLVRMLRLARRHPRPRYFDVDDPILEPDSGVFPAGAGR